MTHLSLGYYLMVGVAGAALLSQTPMFLTYLLNRFRNATKTEPPSIKPSDIETRLEERNKKFQESYADYDVDYNENIDAVIYSREKYNEILQDENNALEPQWARRIMMECTPRGNLIMVYNLYKQSFDCYADNYIPHNLLTAAAMKYVIMYRCRDFFIDSNYVPADRPSKIMAAIKAFDDAKKKKTTTDDNSGKTIRKGPFVRNKPVAPEIKTTEADAKAPVPVPEQTINKFSYMGKLANFSVLRKPKRDFAINGFKTELLDFGNLSYEEYKNIKKTQKCNSPNA